MFVHVGIEFFKKFLDNIRETISATISLFRSIKRGVNVSCMVSYNNKILVTFVHLLILNSLAFSLASKNGKI